MRKPNPKNKLLRITFITAAILCALTCLGMTPVSAAISSGDNDAVEINVTNPVPVEILADYRDKGYSGVIKLPTYTSIDDDSLIKFYEIIFDYDTYGDYVSKVYKMVKSEPLCTCVFKPSVVDGEDVVIMGRNMDLPNSYSPVYVYEINAPDRYRSINIGYIQHFPETFDQIAKTSEIDGTIYSFLPYLLTDGINEKGLAIETNIRSETDATYCNSTNPNASIRISVVGLQRYLLDHCDSIESVLNTLESLDIYSVTTNRVSWHYALGLMDATGRYGVLEFIDNKPVWYESYPGQANFWIDERIFKAADKNPGIGRFDELMKRYDALTSMEAVRDAMEIIWYGQMVHVPAQNMQFEMASEFTGGDSPEILIKYIQSWMKNGYVKMSDDDMNTLYKVNERFKADNQTLWTNSYLMHPSHKADMYAAYNIYVKAVNQLPPDKLKRSGIDQVSVISYVVNNKDKVYHVRFFEQGDEFHFGVPSANGSVSFPVTKVPSKSAKEASSPVGVFGIAVGILAAALIMFRRCG